MKKLFTKIVATMVAVLMLFAIAGCGDKLDMGKEMIKYDSQLDALTQLKNGGSVDAVVIDSVMAGYYATTGDFVGKIKIVENLVLAEESYGIAGRKEDKAFMSEINKALIALYENGTVNTVAATYGLTDTLALSSTTTDTYAGATDDSWEKIKSDESIVIGYTVFAPIAYTEDGVFKGFDIDLAKAVVDYLNTTYTLELDVEFQEIDWDSKEALLSNETIDLIWNGLTITEERSANMCISVPYLYNKQVAVVMAADADKYTDKDSFKDAVIGVEGGSAGESVVKG